MEYKKGSTWKTRAKYYKSIKKIVMLWHILLIVTYFRQWFTYVSQDLHLTFIT